MPDRVPVSIPRRPPPAKSRWEATCIAALLALAATGCEQPCATKVELADRDWCVVEQVAEAARWGRMNEARSLVSQIGTDLARAAAVEAALSLAPRGVSEEDAAAWCGLLEDTYQERCTSTWGAAGL